MNNTLTDTYIYIILYYIHLYYFILYNFKIISYHNLPVMVLISGPRVIHLSVPCHFLVILSKYKGETISMYVLTVL
jgi:hypothetical protein